MLVTDDVELLDDLLRIAAAAHVQTEVASSVQAAAARWNGAAIVLVGADLSAELIAANMPRRDDVVLVRTRNATGTWRDAVDLGAEQLVELPDGEVWLVGRFAELAVAGLPQAPIIAVVGARGGAGASSLAAGLVVVAHRRGLRACAVDMDPLGVGLDYLLGGGMDAGLSWSELDRTRGRVPPGPLFERLARVGEYPVLTWGPTAGGAPAAGALGSILDSLRRSADLVVVDLPRDLSDGCVEAISRVDSLLLVVPRDVGSVRAGARLLATPPLAGARPSVVARGPAPCGLAADEIAEMLGVPVAASMGADSSLRRDTEMGLAPGERGRGPIAKACRAILDGAGAGRVG